MRKQMRAAVGLRVHSGWAALVVMGATSRAPSVIEQRRIVIFDAKIAGSKQPFHAAEKMELKKAEAHIARCRASTRKMAREEFGAVVKEMRAQGHDVIRCGLLLASGRPVGTLPAALASHAMLHTAEGQFYRDALREASEHCAVPVMGVREKELFASATEALRLSESEIRRRVAEMGKVVGAPWSQDEKLAAVVAWLALKKGIRDQGPGILQSGALRAGRKKRLRQRGTRFAPSLFCRG
jgi:hypothetical protein